MIFNGEIFRNGLISLTCISPYYVAHEITKEFWKIINFENMTADFLLRCQNPLRYEISLICH
jgi:hypothetical protein